MLENGKVKANTKNRLKGIWSTVKSCDICIIQLPGTEEKEKMWTISILEYIASNFP